jgi:hypothetical protein
MARVGQTRWSTRKAASDQAVSLACVLTITEDRTQTLEIVRDDICPGVNWP